MKVILLVDTVYKLSPIVVGNCSHKKFIEYVQTRFPKYRHTEDDRILGTAIHVHHKEDSQRYVWVKRLNKSPESLATVVHELFHLVVRILEDRGIMVGSDGYVFGVAVNSDEPAAYLLESYTCQVLSQIL